MKGLFTLVFTSPTNLCTEHTWNVSSRLRIKNLWINEFKIFTCMHLSCRIYLIVFMMSSYTHCSKLRGSIQLPSNTCPTCTMVLFLSLHVFVWNELWCQKQVQPTWINDYIAPNAAKRVPDYSVWNYPTMYSSFLSQSIHALYSISAVTYKFAMDYCQNAKRFDAVFYIYMLLPISSY